MSVTIGRFTAGKYFTTGYTAHGATSNIGIVLMVLEVQSPKGCRFLSKVSHSKKELHLYYMMTTLVGGLFEFFLI